VRSVMNCRVCEIGIALDLVTVTSCRRSLNPIINIITQTRAYEETRSSVTLQFALSLSFVSYCDAVYICFKLGLHYTARLRLAVREAAGSQFEVFYRYVCYPSALNCRKRALLRLLSKCMQ
jgi:hypothetical protein